MKNLRQKNQKFPVLTPNVYCIGFVFCVTAVCTLVQVCKLKYDFKFWEKLFLSRESVKIPSRYYNSFINTFFFHIQGFCIVT